jgi:hypothetical protein
MIDAATSGERTARRSPRRSLALRLRHQRGSRVWHARFTARAQRASLLT